MAVLSPEYIDKTQCRGIGFYLYQLINRRELIFMGKKHGIFLLSMGIIILLLSAFIVIHDPIVGGLGILVGIWNIFIGIRTIKGKWFFGSRFNDEDEE